MVKNGDAHLKNFGLIYSDPSDHSSIRLAPMFDVVTTSVYEFEDTRTGRMLTDRELALKLNKSRSYPTRAEMIHFGRSVCFEDHPEAVFDRVAQAMTDVAKEHWDMLAQDFGERMLKQWTQGMFAFEPDRVFK
jgi:serine/threonine-protein kinase HipA